MTRRHHRLAAYTLSALLALTACGGDDDDPPTTTAPATAPTSPPTTLSAAEQVEATFGEWRELMDEMASAPDPDDQRLESIMRDPLLTRVRSSLEERAAANQVYEIGPESRTDVLDVTDNQDGTATAVVCTIGADTLVDRDTGEVVAEGSSTLLEEVSFVRHDAGWVMTDYETTKTWEGVTTCER